MSRTIKIRKKTESSTAPIAIPPMVRAERILTSCCISASWRARKVISSSYCFIRLSILAVNCEFIRWYFVLVRRIVFRRCNRFSSVAIRIFCWRESLEVVGSRIVSVATSMEVLTSTALSCLVGTNTSANLLKKPFFLGVVSKESRLVITRCCTRCWVMTESCSEIISSISEAESKLSFASLNTRSICIVFRSFSCSRVNRLSVRRFSWSSAADNVSISRCTNTREKRRIASNNV